MRKILFCRLISISVLLFACFTSTFSNTMTIPAHSDISIGNPGAVEQAVPDINKGSAASITITSFRC